MTNRLYWYAAHLTKALQKPVQDGSFGIVSGFTGESCRVPIKAERSGTRKIAKAAGKVGQVTAFVQPSMLFDESGFSLQTGHLLANVVMRFDPRNQFATIADNFPDYVALEGIGFANRMVPTRLCLMFQHTPIEAFADIKRTPVGAA